MPEREFLLDKGIPDLLSTSNLTPELAAEVDFLAGRTDASGSQLTDVHPGLQARRLYGAGEMADARLALDAALDRSWTKQGLAAAVWTASRIGSPETLRRLGQELDLLGDGFIVDGEIPLGSSAMFGGLAAAGMGQLAQAADQLRASVISGDARAPVWGAIARVELARVMWTQADLATDQDTHQQARRILQSARTFFVAGGFIHLASVAQKLMVPPLQIDAASPGLGHFKFQDGWWVGFGVQPPCRVRKGKGLVALQYLIRNNGRRVPVVELERVLAGEAPRAIDLALIERLIAAENADPGDLSDEVRSQLFDDRARSRVSKLLSRTLERLVEEHALVGEYLMGSIETGFACRYHPQMPIVWSL